MEAIDDAWYRDNDPSDGRQRAELLRLVAEAQRAKCRPVDAAKATPDYRTCSDADFHAVVLAELDIYKKR